MKKLLAVVAVVVAMSSVASAHDGPCKAAREKFCKDVKPGGGAIMKCLKEHDKDLSPECKAKMAEKAGEMKKQ